MIADYSFRVVAMHVSCEHLTDRHAKSSILHVTHAFLPSVTFTHLHSYFSRIKFSKKSSNPVYVFSSYLSDYNMFLSSFY